LRSRETRVEAEDVVGLNFGNMSATEALQIGAFLLVVVVLVKPVGAYLERVFERRQTLLDSLLLPVERLMHWLLGVEAFSEMDWKRYSLAFAAFGILNIIVLYFFLRWQVWLPWFFPEVMTTPLTPDLAANTAVSFATTTTWQAYPGESTMSSFSQLLLTLQNFLAGSGSGRRHRFHSRLRTGRDDGAG
jgi:potassium-transporting ATPase potassium-binding subunit